MIRVFAALAFLVTLTACTDFSKDLEGPTQPIGSFKLGHSIVVSTDPQKLLVSRDATADEWIAVVDAAFEERFRRFEGENLYHFGINVIAYSLPPPVVPGKSALQMVITVWDNKSQAKLNEEPKDIQIIRVFESRLSMTREEQMKALAQFAASEVEKWLRDQHRDEDWFPKAAGGDAVTPEKVAEQDG